MFQTVLIQRDITPSSPSPCRNTKSVKEESRVNGVVTRVSRKRPHPAKRAEEEVDEVTEVVEEDDEDYVSFSFPSHFLLSLYVKLISP